MFHKNYVLMLDFIWNEIVSFISKISVQCNEYEYEYIHTSAIFAANEKVHLTFNRLKSDVFHCLTPIFDIGSVSYTYQ